MNLQINAEQLDFITLLDASFKPEQEKKTKVYFNGEGEPLPWEADLLQ